MFESIPTTDSNTHTTDSSTPTTDSSTHTTDSNTPTTIHIPLITGLAALQAIAPDVFGPGYARHVQKDSQSALLRAENLEGWLAQTFEYKGKTYRQEALRLPGWHPEFYFVAPSNEFPFIGFKSSIPDFPLGLPCCFAKPQSPERTAPWQSFSNQSIAGLDDLDLTTLPRLDAIDQEPSDQARTIGIINEERQFRVLTIPKVDEAPTDLRRRSRGLNPLNMRRDHLTRLLTSGGTNVTPMTTCRDMAGQLLTLLLQQGRLYHHSTSTTTSTTTSRGRRPPSYPFNMLELQQILVGFGLPTNGTKAELISRIRERLATIPSVSTPETPLPSS